MIRFDEFFNVEKPSSTKVKFNMNNGNPNQPAWNLLLEDSPHWIGMNSWKSKQPNNNYGNAEYVLSFAQYYPYGPQFFIFGGLYKIEKKSPEVFDQVGYNLTLMDDFSEYRKRLIIKLDRPIGRDLYNRKFENVQESLNPEVYEVAPSTKLGDFPGYKNVLLTHRDLQTIINMEAPEWKRALSCVKGVYCITDTSTGQLYIGSASGDVGGIWQRWEAYANVDDLTGGNKTFEELKEQGAGRIIDNFTYSILEIFDPRTKSDEIVHREEFWKKVFKTVKFGMNN